MAKLIDEIKHDLSFIKAHTLQPQWYKVLKVFILLGFMAGYFFLFGMLKTVLFFAVFFFMSILVHITYRVKTDRWTRSWLDFVVIEQGGESRAESIGIFYYLAIVFNAMLSLVISQIV
ncbi:MAG: hypothetical protein FVQ83_09260 [Chloroflexi bacterium]|nr:hypothetical protein [Chloroflexota bacterium]